MESFLPTLVGAFLGVSLPFVIRAVLDRRSFMKTLNSLFVHHETQTQGYIGKSKLVLTEAAKSWSSFGKNMHQTISKNFEPPVDHSELLLSAYSRYLREIDVFLLAQNKQNALFLYKNLTESNFEELQVLSTVIETLIELCQRKAWAIFMIAKRKNLPFSIDNYNELVRQLNMKKQKSLQKITDFSRFKG